ncbi:MAG: tail fiber domain-containing protein, partial [Lewinella sp.]|nr:tail fiber domain-containing protein [Lewinella sp.]
LRLQQDQSAGWTPQIWDVAGNETNFFVRDVTNGSALSFKIRPGADENSFVIDNDNNIGLGVGDALYDLHIAGNANDPGDVYLQRGSIGINVAPSAAYALDVTGNMRLTGNPIITGTSTFRGDESHFLTTGATFYAANFQPFVKFDAVNSRVGIGTAAPAHQLELSLDDAVKPNGGSWAGPSDRRLKTDIVDFTDGLSVLMDMRPVRYHYNGLLDLPTEQEFIGVIAQDMQAIAPYTVKPLNPDAEGEEDYLAYDGSAVTYILVNAIQEQQAIIDAQQAEIDALQAQVAEIDQLKVQMAQLSRMMAELNAEKAEATTPTRTTDRD